MPRYRYIIICLLLSGCAHTHFFADVGFGNNKGEHWHDCGDMGNHIGLGVTGRIDPWTHWEVGVDHYSQLACGYPFHADNGDESTLDHAGVKIRFLFPRDTYP